MLEQLLNISGLKSLPGAVSADPVSMALPTKNSVVSFTILDKISSEYKILVNGKVFMAVLPVNAKIGDTLLGMVLNNNPMTLNLVNILNLKNITIETLNSLLVKLGIQKTETNLSLLKALIANKKPVLKSKLDKLAEILESLDFTFDETQLSFLIQVFSNEDNFQKFNKRNAEYFRYPINNVIKEIYSQIRDEALNSSSIEQIRKELTIDFEKEGFEKGIMTGLYSRDKAIQDWINENRTSDNLEIKKLTGLFGYYLIQKSFLKKEGIFPGFIIAQKTDSRELIEYKLERTSRENGDVHYLMNLGMRSIEFGDIAIDGILSKSNLTLSFGLEGNNIRYFDEEKDELKKSLRNNVGINTFLSFNGENEGNRKLEKYSLLESINVKA
jgi:hypothetical protein